MYQKSVLLYLFLTTQFFISTVHSSKTYLFGTSSKFTQRILSAIDENQSETVLDRNSEEISTENPKTEEETPVISQEKENRTENSETSEKPEAKKKQEIKDEVSKLDNQSASETSTSQPETKVEKDAESKAPKAVLSEAPKEKVITESKEKVSENTQV